MVRAEVADPPPPPCSQPNRKMFIFMTRLYLKHIDKHRAINCLNTVNAVYTALNYLSSSTCGYIYCKGRLEWYPIPSHPIPSTYSIEGDLS